MKQFAKNYKKTYDTNFVLSDLPNCMNNYDYNVIIYKVAVSKHCLINTDINKYISEICVEINI